MSYRMHWLINLDLKETIEGKEGAHYLEYWQDFDQKVRNHLLQREELKLDCVVLLGKLKFPVKIT